MNRYINADILIAELISKDFLPAIVKRAIENVPTADVVEVRHGRWEEVSEPCFNLDFPVLMGYKCSVCGAFVETELYRDKAFNKKFCGNCGAKMDGERSENGKS